MGEVKLPVVCPSCEEELKVRSLQCDQCGTSINGSYMLPLLLRLEPEEHQFLLDFVKSSGSLKLMAQKLQLSYPTVRNKLDDLIQKIKKLQNDE